MRTSSRCVWIGFSVHIRCVWFTCLAYVQWGSSFKSRSYELNSHLSGDYPPSVDYLLQRVWNATRYYLARLQAQREDSVEGARCRQFWPEVHSGSFLPGLPPTSPPSPLICMGDEGEMSVPAFKISVSWLRLNYSEVNNSISADYLNYHFTCFWWIQMFKWFPAMHRCDFVKNFKEHFWKDLSLSMKLRTWCYGLMAAGCQFLSFNSHTFIFIAKIKPRGSQRTGGQKQVCG